MPPQETLKYSKAGLTQVGSLGPGAHKVLFEPSEYLWWVWVLILNVILPSYHLVGVSPLFLDVKHLFFYEIQHSPDYGCSSVSCNFGVLAGDEHTTFYSTILFILQSIIL